MNQNKHFFILTFAILAILAVIAAGLYLSQPTETASSSRYTRYSRPNATSAGELEQLKSQEFLDEKFTPKNHPGNTEQITPGHLLPAGQTAPLNTAQNSLLLSSRPYIQDEGSNLYAKAAQHATTGSSSNGPSTNTVHTGPQPYAMNTRGNFAPMGSPQMQQAANTPFSPYMAALTKDQAEKLEKQLDGLTDRVQAAVLRSLLPKSKKDANIEKYLSHRDNTSTDDSATSTPAGQFAEVARQLNRQKTGLVESMQNAFGNKAARQAAGIMDSYQQEIMNTLNQPGLTPQQIQQKTHQISQKYNKQLQQLSEKSGLERLEQQRAEQDSVFEQELAQSYGSELAGQLGDIMAKYRQKELELAQKSVTAEEYYTQMYENQRRRHKEMEALLAQRGNSVSGLLEAENKQEQAHIDQQLKEEESGKVLPQIYRASEEEKTALGNSLQQERTEKTQMAQNMYGQAGAKLVNDVYDHYSQEVSKIMENEETSLLEKQQQLMQARQNLNEEIKRIQNNPEMKTLRENKQVEAALEQLTKDPALAQASEEQKAQFEKTARPVLRQMFERINAVVDDGQLTEEQKKQQIQAIEQEALRQLSGQ